MQPHNHYISLNASLDQADYQKRLLWLLQTSLSTSKRLRCTELVIRKIESLQRTNWQNAQPDCSFDKKIEYLWPGDHDDMELTQLIAEAETNQRKQCSGNKSLDATILTLPELVSQYQKPLTPGCPLALQIRGPIASVGSKSVAIIGARHPTLKGRETAYRYAQSLAKMGYFIWSGGAIGIDTCAIQAVLGNAWEISKRSRPDPAFSGVGAVLGSGLQCLYPPSNASLFSNPWLTLVSEFAPSRKAYPYQFPMRNFTIAWLADYILVIEAKRNSGSMITAQCAAALGKNVGAIRWPVGHSLSSGNQSLHDSGADIVECPEQIHQKFHPCNL